MARAEREKQNEEFFEIDRERERVCVGSAVCLYPRVRAHCKFHQIRTKDDMNEIHSAPGFWQGCVIDDNFDELICI